MRIFFYFLVSIALFSCSTDVDNAERGDQQETFARTSDAAIADYFNAQQSGIMVVVEARVVKNLKDDLIGSAHQKFIIELNSGHTLMVSHNIDLANRIDGLSEGERVVVKGQYEWNHKGGLIHWTHHDPAGKHEGGWIEYKGIRYQ